MAEQNEMSALLTEVATEINRARKLHPTNEHLLAALMEEVGELARALLEKDFDHARIEAIQVATVAIRIAEEGEKHLGMHARAREGGRKSVTHE